MADRVPFGSRPGVLKFKTFLKKSGAAALEVGKLALGDLKWTPPHWLGWAWDSSRTQIRRGSATTSTWVRAHKKEVAIGLGVAAVIGVSGYFGWQWYERQPKPVSVLISGTSPGPTPLIEDAKPEAVRISFSASVARLKEDPKTIGQRVKITPPIPGSFKWVNDRQLVFTPFEDWKVDQEYVVRFEKDAIAGHIRLQSNEYRFRSAPFKAQITNSQFYQNPANPKEKRVVVTLKFSHPVDGEDLKKRIELRMQGQKEGILGFGKQSYGFNLTFGKFNGEAYIHSDLLTIPERDSEMVVKIEKGVRSIRGGNSTTDELSIKEEIPGIYNFFRVSQAEVILVPNEKFESDQVLSIQTTTEVDEQELRRHFAAFVLPRNRPAEKNITAKKNYHWRGASDITELVRSQAKPLQFDLIPNERDASSVYNFKFKAEVGQYLYFKMDKEMKSTGDYVLSKDYADVVRVPDYPTELRIMHDGAILGLTGERKLSVLSRSLAAIRFSAGRVLPSQINHLISQTEGRFQHPSFRSSYTFNEENITERFSEIQTLQGQATGRNQYTALDLGRYLSDGGQKRGLFFLKAESWDPKGKSTTGYSDTRFVLVTDLGALVKTSVDRSRDVFVQSIGTGRPVAGVHVEVIGKNGLTVLADTTDADGRAHFPSLDSFVAEQTPTAFVLKKDADISFIPFQAYDRRLAYSRFDIGGTYTVKQTGPQLGAYLFSERGIYRPGDEFNIGVIVKPQDWRQAVDGVPVEAAITDSRGVQIYKEKLQLPHEGFTSIRYRTEETAPTGTYQVSLYLITNEKGEDKRSSLLGSASIKVEEFLPDTMKIQTHLSQERLEGWVSPKDLKGLVSLRNLFGAPAEKRRVAGSLTLSPFFPSFRKYKDYQFFDPARAKRSFSERLQDTETNEKGEAEFDLELNRFETATYRLSFLAEGYAAEGGRSVSAESSVLVSPLESLIGFKADGNLSYIKKDAERAVDLIAVDSALARMAKAALKAELIEHRPVSVLTRQNDGTFRYESVRKEIPVSSKDLKIPKEGLKYALPTDRPGDFALVIRDGKTDLHKIEFSVVGETNIKQKLDKNAELQIKLAKPDYSAGEDIELQITAPYVGAGIITIERERVYAVKWFKTTTTNSTQSIRLPAELEGNGYINVAFVRALDSPEIFTSPLSYGVAPFSVSRARRINTITLDAPELVRPGDPLAIKYRTEKKSKIAIFAVDEGILQVAAYQTPDPLAFFFRKRALEVTTDQLLDLILPEFSTVKAISASGGDESEALGKNLNPFKRKRDKPVVYWSGILDAGPEQQTATYVVPDYFNGQLRIMAVAVSAEAIGVAEKKTFVRGHFVITPNVPTFTTPGDEFEVGVSLSNQAEGTGPGAQIKLSLSTSKHLEVLGEKEVTLAIAEGHEASAHFRVKTKPELGSGNLTFVASVGAKKSRASIDVSVRPATPYITTIATGWLRDEKREIAADRKLHPEFSRSETMASSLPLGLSHGLLRYLEEYPYGCTEQLVSRAFPALVLKSRPEFGLAPDKAENSFRETIRILRARQNADGAFAVWSGDSNTSVFYTTYAYHYLLEARDKGLPVQKELLTRAEDYLKSLLKENPSSMGEARYWAYSIYLLARNGILASNELVALRKILDQKFQGWDTDLAGAYLASTYQLYKQDDEARKLISASKLGQPQRPDYGYYYDGLVRDAALLYLLSKHFPDRAREVDAEQIQALVKPISEGTYNTLSSSYAILALDAYAEVNGTPKIGEFLAEQLVEKNWEALQTPGGLFPKMPLSREASRVRLTNKSEGLLFYQVLQAGFDLNPPKDEVKQGLEVYRELSTLSGSSVSEAEMGEEYLVHVKVRSLAKDTIRNAAIVDLLPSGFEVVLERSPSGVSEPGDEPSEDSGDMERARTEEEEENSGGGDHEEGEEGNLQPRRDELKTGYARSIAGRSPAGRVGEAGSNWTPEFVDIREDRVLLFGTVTTEIREFVYKVKAVNEGTFSIPPIFAESMYDRTLQARGLGGSIFVKGK